MARTEENGLDPYSRYRRDVAAVLKAWNLKISTAWLERVDKELAVPEPKVHHIPDLIVAVADGIAAPDEESSSSSILTVKARELGELRHEQDASVHQLMREYQHLAGVLNEFVLDATKQLDYEVPALVALQLMDRLNGAIGMLMRTTIDTFVEKYTATIAEQHERIQVFNQTVSHELRNPLHSLRLAAELLSGDETRPAVFPQLNPLIIESVERIDAILTTLEALAERPEGLHLQKPILHEVELSGFVGDVGEGLRELLESFEVELRVGELPTVVIEPANTRVVLSNLISNAAKYSDPAKEQRWVEIAAVDDSATDKLTLCVRDNGVGIAPEELPHVFDRNRRGSGDGVAAIDGEGLGLYIVRRCIEAMDGDISIESVPGEGTSVYVVIPVYVSAAAGDRIGSPPSGPR